MSTFPVFFRSERAQVLIIGTGPEAMAKLALLRESGASITLVGKGAKGACAAANVDAGPTITIHDRAPTLSDLDGMTLAYVGDSSAELEDWIVREANTRGIPVNVVDQPHKSTFITPAQFRRGPIDVAFSSGGKAPVFVRRLRALLEQAVSPALGTLASAAGDAKTAVKAALPDGTARRLFWDTLIDRASDFEGLSEEDAASRIIADAEAAGADRQGLVQLVGAGPGDPDLLTLKAHRALQEADVILFDRLVSKDVLSLARRDAERVYVGKREGEHGLGQAGIQVLMVEHAQAGKRVVRLKSGDPLMFARAGEELAALRAAGIRTEVIPGITALAGAAASAQIPVTDRDWSSALTFVTGKTKSGQYGDYAKLAGEGRTLAVYMGLRASADLSAGLIREGVSPSTPVAIIENASRSYERRVYGRMSDLAGVIQRHDITSPALILIGDVVQVGHEWPAFAEAEARSYALAAE